MRCVLLAVCFACVGCAGDHVTPGTKGTAYDPAGEPVHINPVTFIPEGKDKWDAIGKFIDPGDDLLVLADPAPSSKWRDGDRTIEVRVLSGSSRNFVGCIPRKFFVPVR